MIRSYVRVMNKSELSETDRESGITEVDGELFVHLPTVYGVDGYEHDVNYIPSPVGEEWFGEDKNVILILDEQQDA